MTFDAVDPALADGSAGSGVAILSDPVVLCSEGAAVSARGEASDVAGNVGLITKEYRLDFTASNIVAALEGGPVYVDCDKLSCTVTATDALSGLKGCVTTLDGARRLDGAPLVLWDLPLGPHEIEVTAVDYAGNEAVAVLPFETVATLDGLAALKHLFADLGYFSKAPGVVKSLDAKLEAAMKAAERGQLETFSNVKEVGFSAHILST